jgi:hypothetical protein
VLSTEPTPASLDPPSKVSATIARLVGMDSQSVPRRRAGSADGAEPVDVLDPVLLLVCGADGVAGGVGPSDGDVAGEDVVVVGVVVADTSDDVGRAADEVSGGTPAEPEPQPATAPTAMMSAVSTDEVCRRLTTQASPSARWAHSAEGHSCSTSGKG